MIIDYDLTEKRVTIVGGGHETARKVRVFAEAGARVRLVGPRFDREARRAADELRVPIIRCPASQLARRAFSRTDVVAVIADGPELGRRLRPIASRTRVLFYVSDDPEVSDWVQPAVRWAHPIGIAVSTGGGSPLVARILADRLVREVRRDDRLAVGVQAHAREIARDRIPDPGERRQALLEIHRDARIRAALARGDLGTAKRRARQILAGKAERRKVPSQGSAARAGRRPRSCQYPCAPLYGPDAD